MGQLIQAEEEREAEMQRLTEELYAQERHVTLLKSEMNELREELGHAGAHAKALAEERMQLNMMVAAKQTEIDNLTQDAHELRDRITILGVMRARGGRRRIAVFLLKCSPPRVSFATEIIQNALDCSCNTLHYAYTCTLQRASMLLPVRSATSILLRLVMQMSESKVCRLLVLVLSFLLRLVLLIVLRQNGAFRSKLFRTVVLG